jgi:uncharacterized zinc-type alcohol dehydrogenase-like protein
MKFTAYAAAETGGSLHPITLELPELNSRQVLIEVTHCGICHSDLHMIDNDWGVSAYPLVPGHEVVGHVAQVGGSVQGDWIGKRVGLGWQAGSCGQCEWCVGKQENLCVKPQATIVKRYGGFATHVVADIDFIFPIPGKLDSDKAAPLLCGGVTVFSPLYRHGVGKGRRVGVMGIGGLGHMALQFSKAMGAHVWAFSGSPAKEQEAKSLGADEFCITTDATALKSAKNSLDYLLVTATADLDWMPYVNLLRPNGTICFVTGENTRINVPVGHILSNQLNITGSVIGSIETMKRMLEFAEAHGIGAHTECMPMRDVNAALTKVRRNQARYRMVLEA